MLEYAIIFCLVCVGIAFAWPFIVMVLFACFAGLMFLVAGVLDGFSFVKRKLFTRKKQ